MDIRIPDGTAGITAAATGSQETSMVTMPTKTPLASQFPKPCIFRELDNVVSRQISKRQSLNRDRNLSIPIDGKNDVPRPSFQVIPDSKSVPSSSSQYRLGTLAEIRTLSLQERPSTVASKYEHVTKENMCPNLGNGPTAEAYDNAQSFVTCNVVGRLDTEQSMMLSPILVTDKTNNDALDSPSEMQIRNPNNMPFVNYSESPGYSRHVFVTQKSEGIERPLRNESLDISLLDQHSQEVAEILYYVKKQEKRIDALEKEVEEKNGRIDELVEYNSKLNARVMVLETAVALIQEKLEP